MKVVVDTNALHSQVIRELLLSLNIDVIYCQKIKEEWERLFPGESLPTQWRELQLSPFTPKGLPDKDDESILACADQCLVDYLITFNLKDFPQTLTKIRIISPDDFFCHFSDRIQNIYDASFEEFTARLNRARLHKLSRKLSVR